MKIIYNNIIPFPGFWAINLFGVLFVRADASKDVTETQMKRMINHEKIHTAQMRELAYIPFYIIYILEWFSRLFYAPKTAYRGLSFEKEAYNNEDNLEYLATRKHFAQWRKS